MTEVVPFQNFDLIGGSLEREATSDCWSKVIVALKWDAWAMGNGDVETAAHIGIRNSRKRVEPFGEVMIEIERPLVESARAGSAHITDTGVGRAGGRNTEVVLPLLIPGESDIGFAAVGVLCARPPDLHMLFRIKIVVFDSAQNITALVRGANA